MTREEQAPIEEERRRWTLDVFGPGPDNWRLVRLKRAPSGAPPPSLLSVEAPSPGVRFAPKAWVRPDGSIRPGVGSKAAPDILASSARLIVERHSSQLDSAEAKTDLTFYVHLRRDN